VSFVFSGILWQHKSERRSTYGYVDENSRLRVCEGGVDSKVVGCPKNPITGPVVRVVEFTGPVFIFKFF
jgi:hypothetical protein